MNMLIQYLALHNLSENVYSIICNTGMVISLFYSVRHSQKMGISKWKTWVILLSIIICMTVTQNGIWAVLLYIRANRVLGITTAVNSIVRVFWFIPLFCYVLARLLKLKWYHVCDAVALYPLLNSGINQLACLFTGCCHGYPCSWGIYSTKTENLQFPVPILETILTLCIFHVLTVRTKRRGYVSDGKLFPLVLVLYGAMRFVCELLRDNEKLFFGSSAVGIHAGLMSIVGFVVLKMLKKPQIEMEAANAKKNQKTE